MTAVEFTRTPVKVGNSIEEPSQELIETSLNLRQVSLEDAVRYGGPIPSTRRRRSASPMRDELLNSRLN